MCCVLGLRKDLLEDSDLAMVLSWFSRLVRMQICDVEWRHHRNRAASNVSGSTRWANFVASFVNGEAQSSQEARARARKEMSSAGRKQESEPAEPAVAGPALVVRPLRTRAARPLEIFREERKNTNVQTCIVSGIANICWLSQHINMLQMHAVVLKFRSCIFMLLLSGGAHPARSSAELALQSLLQGVLGQGEEGVRTARPADSGGFWAAV